MNWPESHPDKTPRLCDQLHILLRDGGHALEETGFRTTLWEVNTISCRVQHQFPRATCPWSEKHHAYIKVYIPSVIHFYNMRIPMKIPPRSGWRICIQKISCLRLSITTIPTSFITILTYFGTSWYVLLVSVFFHHIIPIGHSISLHVAIMCLYSWLCSIPQ